MTSHCGMSGTIDRVWVGPGTGFKRLLGRGPDRMMRGCFRVSQLGTDVPGIAMRPLGAVGRCVSSADTSLSLSLSLSCPSSTPGLTASSRRFSGLPARYGNPCPAPCSKLPCHARSDVRRPHAVTRDRSLPFTSTIGRQAHCEWTCRAPGGVAGIHRQLLLQRALASRGRGGVARPHSVTSFPCALASRGRGGVAGASRALFLQCASLRASLGAVA